MAELSVSVSAKASAEGPFTVASLAGEADVLCRELEPPFAVLAQGRPALLVVDLSGLRYADGWALSVMPSMRPATRRFPGSSTAGAKPRSWPATRSWTSTRPRRCGRSHALARAVLVPVYEA